ncbi:gamma-glutamyl-gamma-aminobutyrate hydrolase family protein [Rickettsia bellii]|uniref:Glutamine amidotransferase class-I family protein n=3 Tax=Rickettsia bellii TaxID=33990 RepID=A0A0F3QI20_RICBE|nr:gamma-glutamyl-gamma-aminobutyrate hydrolase family protein [Rickettsia bellii]KJV91801.1 glutamine amidotransferase class-I family protein [Rickettsia bellii str. RML Mogi]
MLVTFENIEQIYKLLTTTDLSTLTISTENLKILLAYNQLLDDTEYNEENRKQLKKLLQDNFNEINLSKVAETINDHRAKFTGNIDEHLHEVRLDCINYLLPKIYELSEAPEIKAALKDRSLPLDNIDEKLYEEILPHINELLPKICNSHEISQIKKLFNKEPLPSKDIDQSLYEEILPYTKLLSKMYNLDEAVLAKRLATYFSNIEEIKGYLETVNYTNSDTILWSFQDEQKPDSSNNTKPTIALSYNPEVGGGTAEEAKERIMEQDGNAIYIDYRKIVPLNTKTQSIEKILEAGKAKAKEMLQNVDGLIIPGNEVAVYPELFDSKENFGETDKERSIAESILIDVAIQKGIPITGICGGHQLINVYFGGKLANVDELDYSKVRIDKDLELARITKNSSIVEDLESAHLPPQKFWASHKQIVKKIGNLNFINPVAMIENEIVATESEFGAPIKTFQFHPEILSEQSEIELERNKKIFKIFVETCNNYRNKKINLGEIKQDIEIITEPQDDNHKNEISVENLKDFRNSIKEISSKISTNKYSTFEEIETNNKRLQQIIISKKINRDLNEKEIALINLGVTAKQFIEQNDDLISTLCNNFYGLKSLVGLGFTLERLFSKDTEEQKFLIQNGYNVKTLVELGISLETLFSKDTEEQKFFIQYGYNVKTLVELGISLETLFSKDTEEQKFFIQYGNNIKLLTELGISLETLLSKDTEEQKFFIQNAYNIKYLKEIGISIPELVAMESEQQKFLIQYTSNVKYSIETKFPTSEQKLIIEAILIKKLVSLSEFHNMDLNQQKSFVENTDFKGYDAPVLDQEITDMPVIGVSSEFPTDQA